MRRAVLTAHVLQPTANIEVPIRATSWQVVTKRTRALLRCA
jgi:hypothetical protein